MKKNFLFVFLLFLITVGYLEGQESDKDKELKLILKLVNQPNAVWIIERDVNNPGEISWSIKKYPYSNNINVREMRFDEAQKLDLQNINFEDDITTSEEEILLDLMNSIENNKIEIYDDKQIYDLTPENRPIISVAYINKSVQITKYFKNSDLTYTLHFQFLVNEEGVLTDIVFTTVEFTANVGGKAENYIIYLLPNVPFKTEISPNFNNEEPDNFFEMPITDLGLDGNITVYLSEIEEVITEIKSFPNKALDFISEFDPNLTELIQMDLGRNLPSLPEVTPEK